MVCWIEGGAGFFLFSVLAGAAVELPGRSRPAPGVVDIRRGAQCRALSPDFRLALAVFIPWRGADGFDRRAGWHPRSWCVGSRAAPAFSFLVFCLAPPSSYRVDRGRHLALSTFAGGLNVELSLPIFRLALAVFIPWRGADGFDRRAGWHPRSWCVGSRAAPAFSFLVFCLAPPSSYRVDRGRHLALSTFAGGLNVELSLPIFRLALAVFIPWRGADGFDRRAGWHPRSWCVGSRAAPAFSFLVFCLAPPSSYRVDRGRHLALSTFAGGLNVELSLPIFRLALAVFIPWRGADGFDRRAGWHPRSWCVGSRAAPAFSFLVFCLAPPSSYRVDRGRHLALSTFAGGLNVELSLPIFRLALAVFIPWRGADGFDRRAGWHPRSWCVGSRAAPAFSFLVFCLAPPSSYRVDRGRHLALSTFAGGLNVELSLPIFRLALAVFIPWRGADGFDRRAGWHPR